MAHSLEVRVPFVDVSLLRALAPLLASATPPSKLDMARSSPQPLPDALFHRAKTGFTVPVREWLSEKKLNAENGKQKSERGLRGWAKFVYANFANASPAGRHFFSPSSAALEAVQPA